MARRNCEVLNNGGKGDSGSDGDRNRDKDRHPLT